MTLGGMALAVGILVDDATVTIENVHRNMAMRKPLTRALLDGAQQIAVPTFVSTLSICIVFVPVVLLTGAARFLFTPLAMAVVFAMLASYFFSRTLVPTMVHHMLGPEVPIYATEEGKRGHHMDLGWVWRLHFRFDDWFEGMRERYRRLLEWSLHNRQLVLGLFAIFVAASSLLVSSSGRTFSPTSTPGKCACTCAVRRVREWRPPSRSSPKLTKRSAASSRPKRCSSLSTTSGFRSVASTWRSATLPASAPLTATS